MKQWRVTLYKDHDIIHVEDTTAENRYAALVNVEKGINFTHSNVEEKTDAICHCGRPVGTLAYGSMKVCGTCLSAD